MVALARTRSYQYLDVFTGAPGAVANAVVVQYQIFDISTESKQAAPTQIYPATAGQRASLNVTTDKIGTGHYRTTWAPGATLHGRHRVVWYFTLTADGAETEISEDFDIVTTARSWGYCLPSDMADEGLTVTDASAQRLATIISLATAYIERYTGNYFEPRAQVIQVDGRKGHAVLLDNPIVSLEKMEVSSMFDGSLLEIDLTYCKVYNRHLTDGLLAPDDRHDPKVELLRVATLLSGDVVVGLAPLASFTTWPVGVKNVLLTGVFGYTEADGSPAGTLPMLIRHAAKLLVMREYEKLTSFDAREDRQHRHRIASESTQGMSRSYQARALTGEFFDPEIDMILSAFRRPMALGAA